MPASFGVDVAVREKAGASRSELAVIRSAAATPAATRRRDEAVVPSSAVIPDLR